MLAIPSHEHVSLQLSEHQLKFLFVFIFNGELTFDLMEQTEVKLRAMGPPAECSLLRKYHFLPLFRLFFYENNQKILKLKKSFPIISIF